MDCWAKTATGQKSLGRPPLASLPAECCHPAVEQESPDSAAKVALEVKLALQAESAERARRRRKVILIAGSLANFVSPFAAGALAGQLKLEPLAIAAFLAIPAGIGASVAYFGMTLTAPHADPLEWGYGIPSRCFWYGVAPYGLLCLLAPLFIFGLALGGVLGWVMAIAGGGITSAIINRWFYREG